MNFFTLSHRTHQFQNCVQMSCHVECIRETSAMFEALTENDTCSALTGLDQAAHKACSPLYKEAIDLNPLSLRIGFHEADPARVLPPTPITGLQYRPSLIIDYLEPTPLHYVDPLVTDRVNVRYRWQVDILANTAKGLGLQLILSHTYPRHENDTGPSDRLSNCLCAHP